MSENKISKILKELKLEARYKSNKIKNVHTSKNTKEYRAENKLNHLSKNGFITIYMENVKWLLVLKWYWKLKRINLIIVPSGLHLDKKLDCSLKLRSSFLSNMNISFKFYIFLITEILEFF